INAEMFSPAAAVDAGFLDTLVSADQLQESARAAAQQLKKLNMTAHRNTKLKVRKALLETLDQAIELDKKHLG
ncbi:enoyl-CoA hydratase, partial [Pseudomonas aeruginosa]